MMGAVVAAAPKVRGQIMPRNESLQEEAMNPHTSGIRVQIRL